MDHQLMIDGDSYKVLLAERDERPREPAAPRADAPSGVTREDLAAAVQTAIDRTRPLVEVKLESEAAPAKPAEIDSDVDHPSYPRKAWRKGDFAVVIGVEDYENVPKATFAERDADAVREH